VDCPKHPLRKRPKTCETCAKPYADPTKATATKTPWPYVTEDGAQWLDRDGNSPKLDMQGRLAEAFEFMPNKVHGVHERWGAGMKLPMTPAVFSAWAADLEAKRARTIKPKENR
jgi:hypothetical protein